jgi:diacylglycerol kinase family enzyme
MSEAQDALAGLVVAILNIGSGSCDASSEGKIRRIFTDAGLSDAEILSVAPAEVTAALESAVNRADVLVILGGDGTIGAAATLCGGSGPYLIPLPGGTMNMLPRALYGTADWQMSLRQTLSAPSIRKVSGGEAGGHRFYCAAILGAPSLWADAREAVREGHLLEAAKRALTATRRSLSDSIDYEFGEVRGSAEAVAVICPLISQQMSGEETALEAAALDPSTAAGLFGLAFHAAFDGWRSDASVTRAKVSSVVVRAHGEIPLILDGEAMKMPREVEVAFLPNAFRALVPAPLPAPAGAIV